MDHFANAQAFVPEDKGSKKSKTRKIPCPDLMKVGAFKLLKTNFESLQKTLTMDVVSFAINSVWLKEIRSNGRVPDNFRGTEEAGEGKNKIESHASIQLNAKTCTTIISDDEIELFAEHGIPVGTMEIGIDAFIFNPKYKDDAKVMGALAEAVKNIPGLPSDIILKMTSETKTVISEDTLPAICAKAAEKDADGEFKMKLSTVRNLIAAATTPKIVPNFGSTDVRKAYELVRPMLTLEGGEDQAETTVEAPEAPAPATVDSPFGAVVAVKAPTKGRTKRAA